MTGIDVYLIILAGLILFIFYRLKPLFRTRRIIENYRAELLPVDNNEYVSGGSAVLQRVYYEDGNSELRLSLYGTDFPGNSTLKLNVNGYTITEFRTYKGGAYLKMNSDDGISVPYVGNGDKAEIIFEDAPVLSGIIERN